MSDLLVALLDVALAMVLGAVLGGQPGAPGSGGRIVLASFAGAAVLAAWPRVGLIAVDPHAMATLVLLNAVVAFVLVAAATGRAARPGGSGLAGGGLAWAAVTVGLAVGWGFHPSAAFVAAGTATLANVPRIRADLARRRDGRARRRD